MLYDSFTAIQESWQDILSGMLDFSVISTNKTCLDFNRSKLLVEFNEETHRCCSCKVRRNGSECVYEDACPHVVCKSCLQRHYHKYDPESWEIVLVLKWRKRAKILFKKAWNGRKKNEKTLLSLSFSRQLEIHAFLIHFERLHSMSQFLFEVFLPIKYHGHRTSRSHFDYITPLPQVSSNRL